MGVRGKREGNPGAVKGKGSPVVSPARVEDSIVFDLPSAPFLTSSSGSPWGGGEVRNGADGSARRADAGGRGCRAIRGAHSARTPCRGPVRVLCGGCAGFPGALRAPVKRMSARQGAAGCAVATGGGARCVG